MNTIIPRYNFADKKNVYYDIQRFCRSVKMYPPTSVTLDMHKPTVTLEFNSELIKQRISLYPMLNAYLWEKRHLRQGLFEAIFESDKSFNDNLSMLLSGSGLDTNYIVAHKCEHYIFVLYADSRQVVCSIDSCNLYSKLDKDFSSRLIEKLNLQPFIQNQISYDSNSNKITFDL